MEEAGLKDIGVYILKRQYIAKRPIMDLCEQSVRRTGAWVSRRWWEQDGINLIGARDWEAEAADGEEERIREEAAREETKGRR